MDHIHTTIDIDAPAATVWRVLTEFEAYPDWNPVTRIEGDAVEGAQLRVSPGPDAGDAPTFRPRVIRADPGREFRWLGHLYVRGLFDGEHAFAIEDRGDGRSRLVQSERFSGLLVRPILRYYGARTATNFEEMNAALKARAESLAAGSVLSAESTRRDDPSSAIAATA